MNQTLILFAIVSVLAGQIFSDDLERGFAAPPASARPGILWMWMDGNVTKEGITADLEAMKRVGLSGVILYADLSLGATSAGHVPSGPVKCLNPQWMEMVGYALDEAQRLGLDVFMQNGPGWTGNGGPWVSVEHSMQRVIASERRIAGPGRINLELPRPSGSEDFYRDEAVLAVKLPTGAGSGVAETVPQISTTAGLPDSRVLFDANPETAADVCLINDQPQSLTFSFETPYTARSFYLLTKGENGASCKLELQFSNDGANFLPIGKADIRSLHLPELISMSFAPITSRYYRIVFSEPKATGADKCLSLKEMDISPDSRLENWGFKAACAPNNSPPQMTRVLGANVPPAFDSAEIRNISKFFVDNRLVWDVPEGQWLIMRMGHISTGRKVRPTLPGNEGYDSDKLRREALDAHWEGMVGKVLVASGGKLRGVHCDSYEAGFQNWTPGILELFKSKRGYDPQPYLPVLTGRIADTREISERFLWDWRRTLSELQVENNYARFRELCLTNGLVATVEPYGAFKTFDSFAAGQHADLPMTEFWVGQDDTYIGHAKMVSSAAHVTGRPVVGAEAFTAIGGQARWNNHPYTLKVLGDRMFASGVNRFMLHAAAHQPWLNRHPGMTFSLFGTHFYRTQTWWKQSRGWMDYLARSQFLLQQGRFIADVCILLPEEFPGSSSFSRPTSLPSGYDFDVCSAEVVIGQMRVEGTRLVLPSGMSYRLLVLPDRTFMTPQLLKKISELVKAGATVIGPRPEQSPSLVNYPSCDEEVRRLAAELWGGCNGKTVTHNIFGKGDIYWGHPLADILTKLNLCPDFETDSAYSNAVIRYVHRQTDEADIYFVANGKEQEEDVLCTFRVTGKLPELWHPDTGKIEVAPRFNINSNQTVVPLHFDPAGSVFVIFRKPATEMSRTAPLRAPLQPIQTLDGAWNVSFPPNLGAPEKATFGKLISWTESADPGIKYFSGTAVYTHEFELTDTNDPMVLDLGRVEVIAEITLNGKNLGILWKPPFRADISGVAQKGRNKLEVKITNLWANRLIGDEQLPDDGQNTLESWPKWLLDGKPSPSGRVAFTTFRYFRKTEPLLPSGLLGPVTVKADSKVCTP